MMHRRDFISTTAALIATAEDSHVSVSANETSGKQAVTVSGAIDVKKLGATLPHEHVMVDFIGADKISRDSYEREQVFEVILPRLQKAKQAGCQSVVECTPAYLGRDPILLKRLATASGLNLLTNTGYYGAGDGKFLPAHAFEEDADQLAARWLNEWKNGIEDSGVRPGFIKIGVDSGPLSEVNQKLVRAAARVHLQSGLTIACHTGDGAAAMQEMAILRHEGVDPSAWIWVHAQNDKDQNLHLRAAERGGWVEFDGISADTIERHVELVQNMKRHELLSRVLLSHDAGWYSVGEPEGGQFRSYSTLFEQFIPALQKVGFGSKEIDQLIVENPANAFAINVRPR